MSPSAGATGVGSTAEGAAGSEATVGAASVLRGGATDEPRARSTRVAMVAMVSRGTAYARQP
jgi:hypothetical protein